MKLRYRHDATNWLAMTAALLLVSLVCRGETSADEQRAFADGLFHRGFYDEAIDEYERYLEHAPAEPEAARSWLRLGRAAIMTGAYEKALYAFDQAATVALTDMQRLDARISRGETLFLMERFGEAAEALAATAAAEAAPDTRARALYYLGRALHEVGDTENAIAAFKRLTTEAPDTATAPFAQYHLGYALLDADRIEDAAAAFTAAANAESADDALRMESRFRAAELYDKLGWTAAALGAYEQLRSVFPDSEYARRADYGYAWALYHDGRYDDALVLLERLLEEGRDPRHAAGLTYLVGNCYYQQRRYEDAVRIYDRVRTEYPDSDFAARGLYKTAWAHHITGASSAAREAAAAFLELYHDTDQAGDARYLLGVILVVDGDYEEALEQFLLVAEDYPDSEFGADALFKAGECQTQLGLRNEAARTFEAFARRYPDNPLTEQAMLRSGDARFTAADFEEALENYMRILDDPPGDEHIVEETLYRTAVTYHNMKAFDDSAAMFQRLIEAFPESAYALEAQFRIAEYELREREDPLQAIVAYEKVLNSPGAEAFAVRALQGLAAARYEQKDYEQAAEQLLQLVRDHPGEALSAEAYMWSAQWLRDAERWDDAAAMYEAMLTHYPDHEERGGLWFFLGECREHAGVPDKAIAAYKEALDYAADSARAATIEYRLGTLHQQQEALDEALALFEAAANRDGGEISARARFKLATVQEALGNHDAAARNYMRLAILFVHETLSPESLWRAGNCYLALENPVQAREVFGELLRDYPDSPFAEQARERLETLATHADAGE